LAKVAFWEAADSQLIFEQCLFVSAKQKIGKVVVLLKSLLRKIPKTTLVMILIFSLFPWAASAAWTNDQMGPNNNGLITAAPHYGSTPTINSYTLPNNGWATHHCSMPWRSFYYRFGVGTESVINGNKAYTLYDGGAPGGLNGGARLSSIDISGCSPIWNIQLDSSSDNGQYATPYLDITNNRLFAAVTYFNNDLSDSGLTGWKDNDDNPLASFTFPAGTTTTIHYDGLYIPAAFSQPQLFTDIDPGTNPFAEVSGAVTLSDGTNTYDLGETTYYGGNFTMYNMNSGNGAIPAGMYTLTVSLTTSETLTATTFQFLTSRWNLYQVSDLSSYPTVQLLGSGYGQAGTPLSSNNTYLYFGVFDGDRCYYQYNIGSGELSAFTPDGGADFLLAGAVLVAVGGSSYAVFGSDGGTVYVRPVGDTFSSGAGNSFQPSLSSGNIRSAVCSSDSYIYYTGDGGYLFKTTTSTLLNPTPATASVALGNSSMSTPVVTSSGYVYVGTYDDQGFSGSVLAIPVDEFSNPETVYSGNAVQCSVTAYTSGNEDYVFFTANGGGWSSGFCYSYDGISGAVRWNTNSAGFFTYAGMASSNGYLVFGNNENTLYVISGGTSIGGTGDSTLNSLLAAAGFEYNPTKGIFQGTMYAPQRHFGYCGLYDLAAPALGIIFDCEPITFQYPSGNLNMIEAWKGQYTVNTGFELGVYTRGVVLGIPGILSGNFYFCPDSAKDGYSNDERLTMSYTAKKNGSTLFSKEPERHWWLTGFKAGEFSNYSSLTMQNVSVTLKNSDMRTAYIIGLNDSGYSGSQISVSGNTVTFNFDVPLTHPSTRDIFEQSKQAENQQLCSLYNTITSPYTSMADKLNAVRTQAPDLFNKITYAGTSNDIYNAYETISSYLP
jgi:hypothetical protein